MTSRVLVVGGSGFIGTRLLDELRDRGTQVVNLDLERSARHDDVTVVGDVRDRAAVDAVLQGCTSVVHLAAVHRDDVRPLSLYASVNVDGTRVLAEAAAAAGVDRVVFTSTVAVYGLDAGHPDESATPRPFNEYGRTKLQAEQVLRAWAEAGPGRSLSVVRPCVVFGEGNRGNVHTFIAQVASRRFVPVGSGQNRKSMAYVGNVAAFLASRLDAGAPGVEVVNYADTPDLTTRELVALVRRELTGADAAWRALPLPLGLAAGHVLDAAGRVTGRSFPVSAVRVRKFAAETTVDTTRLRSTGFRPPVPLAEGLRRMIAADFADSRRP